MIFDTHIHLNDEVLFKNLDNYLKDALNDGVSSFMCIGYDLESSKKHVKLHQNMILYTLQLELFLQNTSHTMKILLMN